MIFKTIKIFESIISILFALVLWEFFVRVKLVPEAFVSMPSKIFLEGLQLITSGFIFPHLFVSLEALTIGFFLAICLGVVGGLFIGSSTRIYKYFHIHIIIVSAIPIVALVPLVMVWFGIGIASKIAVVFFMSFVPIIINTIDGTKNIDKKLLKMAISNEASKTFVMREIILYNTVPFVFSGARIAAGRAVAGLVISEIFGYGTGLGYLISFYSGTFQIARLLFVVALFVFITILLTWIIKYVETKVVYWNN